MNTLKFRSTTCFNFILWMYVIGMGCSSMKKIDCPDGPVFIPRKAVPYPDYVVTADRKIRGLLALTKTVDSATVSVDVRRKLTLLRDTLNQPGYLIDNGLSRAKALHDQYPCNKEYADKYLQMIQNVQSRVLPRIQTLESALQKELSPSNFGHIDESAVIKAINNFLEK
jgi:hypothetical protein